MLRKAIPELHDQLTWIESVPSTTAATGLIAGSRGEGASGRAGEGISAEAAQLKFQHTNAKQQVRRGKTERDTVVRMNLFTALAKANFTLDAWDVPGHPARCGWASPQPGPSKAGGNSRRRPPAVPFWTSRRTLRSLRLHMSPRHRLFAVLLPFTILTSLPAARAEVHLPAGFKLEMVAGSDVLSEPMDLTFAPDGAAWVTGRAGNLWRIDPVAHTSHRIGRVDTDISGDRGMHGIALHPDFPRTSEISHLLSRHQSRVFQVSRPHRPLDGGRQRGTVGAGTGERKDPAGMGWGPGGTACGGQPLGSSHRTAPLRHDG